jgi:hypothetical protein
MAAPDVQSSQAPPMLQGQLRMMPADVQTTQEAPRMPTGRMVAMGTDQQRTEAANKQRRQQLLQNPNITDRERLAIEMENAGMKVPAGVFEPRPLKEPTPHYSFMPTYDDNGNPTGIATGNTLTGAISDAHLPGGRQVRPPKTADNPQNPRGVQNYLLQLRNTHGNDLQSAEQELAHAWPEIVQAHPHVEAATVVGALRSMFGNAPGASANQLPPGLTLPTFNGRGAAPTGGPAPASPRGGKPGPALRERRMINGHLGEWDGRGWKPVS